MYENYLRSYSHSLRAEEDRKMHVVTVACFLVFTFTIAECKHLIDKRQDLSCVNISPSLLECLNDFAAGDFTLLCNTDCGSEIQSYFEVCNPSSLEAYMEGYNQICGELSSGSGSGDDACLPINFSSELEDCLNSYASITPGTTVSDSPACTSECRYEIEDYADRCLNATAQMYKDVYRIACGLPSGESSGLRAKHFILLYMYVFRLFHGSNLASIRILHGYIIVWIRWCIHVCICMKEYSPLSICNNTCYGTP